MDLTNKLEIKKIISLPQSVIESVNFDTYNILRCRKCGELYFIDQDNDCADNSLEDYDKLAKCCPVPDLHFIQVRDISLIKEREAVNAG